jgi:hypothetical protein
MPEIADENRHESAVGGYEVTVKQIGILTGIVFAVALAVVVGLQMSTEAMAVVIGVVCGVAAGIPTSVLLLVALTHREKQHLGEADRQMQMGGYPPVVVIQGGTPQPLPSGLQSGYWPAAMPWSPARREFNVVGGDDLLLEDGSYRR